MTGPDKKSMFHVRGFADGCCAAAGLGYSMCFSWLLFDIGISTGNWAESLCPRALFWIKSPKIRYFRKVFKVKVSHIIFIISIIV